MRRPPTLLIFPLAAASLLVADFAFGQPAPSAAPQVSLSASLAPRIAEIEAMLPEKPQTFAPSFDNRAPWDKLAADTEFRDATFKRADYMLTQPIPEVTEAQWDEAIRTKDRKVEKVLDLRRNRLAVFMLSEGMQNQGKYVPAILKEIETICGERSWVFPAHQSFTGSNDLGSAMTSWSLATAIGMLGDRMPDSLRQTVKENISRRVITPYLDQSRDASLKKDWWRTNENNWNAVVHAGIVGSALTTVDSRAERAEVLAVAISETPFYLGGFAADGYSHEGMGYWKYGFGHFILMAETVYSATSGRIDLLKDPVARKLAEFPLRFDVAEGIYPAFGDCQLYEQQPTWIYNILSSRFGIGLPTKRSLVLDGTFYNFLYAWGVNLGFAAESAASQPEPRPLRDWFENNQVLVARTAPGVTPSLGVAMKGGNNGIAHSHNDLGQFVVALNGKLILTDPGMMDVGGQIYGPNRYDSAINNSYGHSVPVVGGKLQGNGPAFGAQVVDKSFSDKLDSVTLSLRGGYNLFAINELTRRLELDREAGRITVTDHLTADKPIAFGTGLSTYGEAKEESPGVWLVTRDGQTLRVTISAGGVPFSVKFEQLKDKSRFGQVRRLGIELTEPSADATITTVITPAS